MSNESITIYRRKALMGRVTHRPGERKLGEALRFLGEGRGLEALGELAQDGVRHVLVGIPESVGPLANHGQSGADQAWSAFLDAFLNLQSNRFLTGEAILCLGHVATEDLLQEARNLERKGSANPTALRRIVERLDDRVWPVVAAVVSAGMTPVVIGGGHNNAYPILKGAFSELGTPAGLDCLNVDPHGDLRPLEGRHSGNAFSYAFRDGLLHRYFVLGLHEAVNPEHVLDWLSGTATGWVPFEPGRGWGSAMAAAKAFFGGPGRPLGLEVDLDAAAGMPVSAYSPSGFALDDLRAIVREAAASFDVAYLHLPEGAPQAGTLDEKRVGKALALLVHDFIRFDAGRRSPGKGSPL